MPFTLLGQDMNKVVFVESEFKPIIENAEKMGVVPGMSDTLKPQIDINYSVLPSRIDAKYEIKPIKPAKLVGSPIDKLYHSRLRLGIGNYTSPLAEFSIHNLRSKEYAVGAYVYHKSSHTKLALENGHKVPAGYGKNIFSVYGKRFYDNVNVEGEVAFNSHKHRFYGYNTSNFPVSYPSVEGRDIRQWYSQFLARAEVYSTDVDSKAMQYRIGIIADYFGDDFSNSQNHVDIPAYLSFMINDFRLDINARYHYFHSVLDTLRGVSDNVFQVRPVLRKKGDQWDVMIGVNSYVSSYGKANFFPEAKISFEIVPEALSTYFGVEGDLELNHFSKVARENIYITPGLNTLNTKNKLTGYGGFKGKISSQAGYLIDFIFKSQENALFFVNDTITALENTFKPVYDNAEIITLGTELWYSPLTYLDFFTKLYLHNYQLGIEEKPWHKPLSEFTFTTRYNYKEKLYINFDILHEGVRYAKNFSASSEPLKLDAIWDLNLRFEYKYSNVLSAYLDCYNLLSKRYYVWNQYPSQRLNAMIGFSYKF
jgi:hypothetical protein